LPFSRATKTLCFTLPVFLTGQREGIPWKDHDMKSCFHTLTALLICLLLLIPLFASCQRGVDPRSDGGRLKVITTLFPLYDFTRNIGGNKVHVSLLLPPGVEPHSFEPKPGDMLKIAGADLFIFTGKSMEPWVDGILKGVENKKLVEVDSSKGIDLIEQGGDAHRDDPGHDHGRADPHIWLDLSKAEKIVDNILEGLIKKDPANNEYYRRNADSYKAKLSEMDEKYRGALSTCKKRVFVHGGHFAFGYLAKKYNLEYVSAYHGSPDAEPTPKRLIELKSVLKRFNLHYIFYEELITPRVAEIISRETGAALLKLHGGHNVSRDEMDKGITFLSIMEENLKNLKVGLECQ
jgi:zinc transport system substrate-binding protein